MQKVLTIVGPTAMGKTKLAVALAPKIGAEIVSGDSMQVYREVSIGTAKASLSQQAAVKHYLINTRSVFQSYSVKNFVDQARGAIAAIAQKGKLPLIVGGTGFYIKALLNQMQLGRKGPEQSRVAANWQAYLTRHGPQKLWQVLKAKDPAAAAKIPVANQRRTLRALTVIERTGKSFSGQQTAIKARYDYLIIGLNSERQRVYARINDRVDSMLAAGLLKEAAYVYRNRAQEHQILQAIGYKEFFPYFAGHATLASCVNQLKTSSRRYAKRQLTYFRHQLPVNWFDPLRDADYESKILQKVKEWLNV